MASVCLYFQVHQPFRIFPFTFFDIGNDRPYFNDVLNKQIIEKVADNCYIPANGILLNLIEKFGGRFKLAFSISGVAMEQLALWRPDVIDSFRQLAETGCVEFLGETYYHSLSSIFSPKEFSRQVKLHASVMEREFGHRPSVFRNTELVYWDGLVPLVKALVYNTLITEGWDPF
ncbi:MAG: a-amylase, partial [Cytophagales bacterium]|nr:a-amylase [Cytophagales bacterium]